MITPLAKQQALPIESLESFVFSNLPVPELVEHAIRQKEAKLADSGALNMLTGKFTGRCPKDRYIVQDDLTKDLVHWGEVNQPVSDTVYQRLRDQVFSHLCKRHRLYVRHVKAVQHPEFAQKIRVYTESAAQNLFVNNLFLPQEDADLPADWSVFVASSLQINDYETLGLRNSNAVVLDLSRREVLIIGTAYTGEIKKSVFSVLNFYLPHFHQILPMHCAANVGEQGDTALFFGLSGTGKTTLSTDVGRYLVGDDEHGWGTDGIFNFEGGCYAKCIHLDRNREPDIFNAIRFGALTENICLRDRSPDYNNKQITENIRVSYPLSHISSLADRPVVSAPTNIFFLCADAFGILPPIARLDHEQALYYFINGYTAKVAGTEIGIDEPKATFSACFGEAFLPLHPMRYAEMLNKRLKETKAIHVWLVNTGWIGGPYGIGRRIPLQYTRAIIRAALSGDLQQEAYQKDVLFGFHVPKSCPDVPDAILDAAKLWGNPEAYGVHAMKLKNLFEANFAKYTNTERHGI